MTTVLPPIRDFAGDVLMPGDADYEDARRVFNAAIDRRPEVIARCAGAHDVAAALRHARERGLAVTVRAAERYPDRPRGAHGRPSSHASVVSAATS